RDGGGPGRFPACSFRSSHKCPLKGNSLLLRQTDQESVFGTAGPLPLPEHPPKVTPVGIAPVGKPADVCRGGSHIRQSPAPELPGDFPSVRDPLPEEPFMFMIFLSRKELPDDTRAKEAVFLPGTGIAGPSAENRFLSHRVYLPTASFISRTTSPSSAWRPISFLEKIRFPSTSTSKTPPPEGTRRISPISPRNSVNNSSATRAA